MEVKSEIDRTKWATEQDGDVVVVTLDGHEAGFVRSEPDGTYSWSLTDWDFHYDPVFKTAKEAVEMVKVDWAGWWLECIDCSEPTVESDYRWPGVAIPAGVSCAECRREAGRLTIRGLPVEGS